MCTYLAVLSVIFKSTKDGTNVASYKLKLKLSTYYSAPLMPLDNDQEACPCNLPGGAISYIDMNPTPKTYTIQKISERLGLPKSTLRYWEKEFDGFIFPERTAGGHRRYTYYDLSILQEICKQKNRGFSLSEIKRKLQANPINQPVNNAVDLEALTDRIIVAVRTELLNYLKEINKGEEKQSKG